MKHLASPQFWACFKTLSKPVQQLARKSFTLLKHDPRHPSLHFKQIGRFWSVRIGLFYRALGVGIPNGVLWFWIGSHADYDNLIG
ncbi:MAG: hypothetical protein M1438_12555 [Deltaproteobacteria bacterium]|nr:hypothetical protein [Deltaproteobacteria bacterium]